MISRDTAVHVGAVIVAFGVLALFGDTQGPQSIALVLVFYGLVLGGAHCYLAIRGEDGIIPVEARWRYVTALAVILVAAAMIVYGGDRAVLGVSLESVGLAVIVVTALAYLLVESISGYRASRRSRS